MKAGADSAHRRARAAFGMVAILVGVVAVPTAGPPVALAELERRVPFDSNGQDDSFAVAMSRPQGPLIGGPEELELQSRSRLAAADIPDTGDPVRGSFGAQVAWPIMPIHAVLMPDGRVLTYGTDRNGVQTAYYDYDVWTPALGTGAAAHNTLVNGTQTDIFCSSQIVLLNGDVEMYGGDNLPAETNTQNRDVNQYLPASDTLVRTGSMHRLRWYSTAINLPNGEVYIQGGSGGADFPEVRDNNGQFRLLTGASTSSLSSGYPRNFVAPDGLVFSLANTAMSRINPAGTGTITSLGTFPTDNTGGSSTAVMFAPGRILQVGGGPSSAASRRRQHHQHQRRHAAGHRAAAGAVRTALGQRHRDGGRSRAGVRRQRRQQRRHRCGVHDGDLQPGGYGHVVHGPDRDAHAPVPLDVTAAAGCQRDHDGRRDAGSRDEPQRRDLLPALPVQR